MADRSRQFSENAEGRFFVDDQCIDCDLCRSVAPKNFRRQDARGYSYVFKQPEGEDELKKVCQAVEECPVNAIGAGEREKVGARAS